MSNLLRAGMAAALVLSSPLCARAHEGHDHGAAAATATAPAEALSVARGFTRATRPGAPVAGGFMVITNATGRDDRLVGARSPAAGVTQLHEMAMAEGVMRMRELAQGLPIPAGATVALRPGGYHVMFMDLKAPLVEGARIEVTLTFERAGEVTVPLAVLAPDAEDFPGAGE
ncbi:copper chaperone PCu(A)C [Amaricoccus solimangrovi]|uniref:Copper chaperone PCu(A)C n=1 Tax=Amaricoccus solimangrovi TaxID=2589815 RepID=A0A501WQ16_9RHOB|nr:copper chaperone PCu(A)C [Amaricoccus solimangrovi]TPE51438.1 copper chaperone PCu(A)C [Amaricoccus solimangrovi]